MRHFKFVTYTCIVSLLLAGCGSTEEKDIKDMSKSELIEEYNALQSKYYDALLKGEELSEMLEKIDLEASGEPSVTLMTDGSGNMTLNTYSSKMIFPETFQYPESTEIAANSKIDIIQNVSISPNNNWISKLNAASVEMEHSTGVEGIIKVGYVNELYNRDNLRSEVLEPWFDQITNKNVVYKNIFINNTMFGEQATTTIYIDEEEAQLTCGMLAISNTSMIYIYVYRGARDANKDEAISAVINSIKIYGNDLTVG